MSIFKSFFNRKKIREILSRSDEAAEEPSLTSVAHSELAAPFPAALGRRQWAVGDVVQDRYEITRVIDSGGMGLVYIVYDFKEMNHLVFKTFKDKFLRNEAAIKRFLQEAETLIKLPTHPNLVQAEMAMSIEGRPFLVMEYVPGDNLRAWIGQAKLTITRCLDFAIQFCQGMNHAYRQMGLIHRDVKPENIMINRQGLLKIADVGLAKLASESFLEEVAGLSWDPESKVDALAMTRLKGGFGTPPYMPPEQFEAAKNVGPEADVYAFGVTLYEMLTGRWPFHGPKGEDWRRQHQTEYPRSPIQLNKQIPLELSNLVLKCLAKDPAKRYPDFAALQGELEGIYQKITHQAYQSPEALNEKGWCDRGLSHFEAGELQPALAACEQALAVNPQSARAWLHKADVLVRLGRYEEALQGYDQALQVSRWLVPVWNNRGLLLHMLDRETEALRCYDELLKLNPEYYLAWNNRSLSLFRLGRLREALVDTDQALALEPSYADAWFNRGFVLHQLGWPQEALVSFNKVIDLTPHNPRPWKQKAIIFAGDLGEVEEALACLDQALAIDPEDEDALGSRELLLEYLQQEYGPQVAVKWARVKKPDIGKVEKWEQMARGLHQGTGTVLAFESKSGDKTRPTLTLNQKMLSMYELGNYAEAIRYADQALAIDSADVIAWTYKGASLAQQGQAQTGLECLDHALALEATFHPAWNVKGVMLHNLCHYEEAIECFDEAIRLKPAFGEAWNNKGNAVKEMDRHEEALACYDRALAIDSRNAVAWSNKGAVLVDLIRYEEALACCHQAVELDPRLENAWLNKGVALKRLKRYEEALGALDRAVELNPRSTKAWESRGEVLMALDRFSEAKQAIERGESLKQIELARESAALTEAVEARIVTLEPGIASNPTRIGIARALRDLGRYEESLTYCEQVLALEPGSRLGIAVKVVTLVAMRRYEAALAGYDELLALEPDDALTWMHRGDVLKKLGHPLEALTSYEQAIRLDPGEQAAVAWDAKGLILEEIGRLEEALDCYDRALHLNPKFEWAWINKGLMFFQQGRYREAIQCYDQALTITSTNDAAWNNKGNALKRLSADAEEVLYCYVRAIQLNPGNEMALNNAGVVYLDMQRNVDALGYFEKALALDAHYQDAWLNKGEVLQRLARYDEALACFDEVLRLNPEAHKAWATKGLVLSNQGQLAEALACLDRSLALYPHNYVPWFNKGALLFNDGRPTEALVCFDRALALAPDDKQVREVRQICWQTIQNAGKVPSQPVSRSQWLQRGQEMARQGRLDEELKCYDEVLALDPEDEEGLLKKGLVLAQVGRYEQAIKHFDRILQLNPNNENAWESKGMALSLMEGDEAQIAGGNPVLAKMLFINRMEEAIGYYEKALSINPKNVSAWMSKGNALWFIGRVREAMACFDRALSLEPDNEMARQGKVRCQQTLSK